MLRRIANFLLRPISIYSIIQSSPYPSLFMSIPQMLPRKALCWCAGESGPFLSSNTRVPSVVPGADYPGIRQPYSAARNQPAGHRQPCSSSLAGPKVLHLLKDSHTSGHLSIRPWRAFAWRHSEMCDQPPLFVDSSRLASNKNPCRGRGEDD